MKYRTQRSSMLLAATAFAAIGFLAFAPGCASTDDGSSDGEQGTAETTEEQALAEKSLAPQEANTSESDPEPLASVDESALDEAAVAAATPEQKKAIQWMKNHLGSTGWEHYCEKAVENAYGTSGVWASAKQHWQNATVHNNRNAPYGAFVYWNISQWGHVGISDGNGGFYSTGIGGKIGHKTSLGYFGSYVGWSTGTRPRR
ncbi:hypothetical protein [Pendulispora albinea]|uniref:CHAP domain-containing protein n=1 Tax=Pendulispora albinea TaxID=2741071 RepID=A0ABZ2LVR0_9BACT